MIIPCMYQDAEHAAETDDGNNNSNEAEAADSNVPQFSVGDMLLAQRPFKKKWCPASVDTVKRRASSVSYVVVFQDGLKRTLPSSRVRKFQMDIPPAETDGDVNQKEQQNNEESV